MKAHVFAQSETYSEFGCSANKTTSKARSVIATEPDGPTTPLRPRRKMVADRVGGQPAQRLPAIRTIQVVLKLLCGSHGRGQHHVFLRLSGCARERCQQEHGKEIYRGTEAPRIQFKSGSVCQI